jgi:hypothetical protein
MMIRSWIGVSVMGDSYEKARMLEVEFSLYIKEGDRGNRIEERSGVTCWFFYYQVKKM